MRPSKGRRRRRARVRLILPWAAVGGALCLSSREAGGAAASAAAAWAGLGSRREFGAAVWSGRAGPGPPPPCLPRARSARRQPRLCPSPQAAHGDCRPRSVRPRGWPLPPALPPGAPRHLRRVPPALPGAAQPPAGHRHPQVLVSAARGGRRGRGGGFAGLRGPRKALGPGWEDRGSGGAGGAGRKEGSGEGLCLGRLAPRSRWGCLRLRGDVLAGGVPACGWVKSLASAGAVCSGVGRGLGRDGEELLDLRRVR